MPCFLTHSVELGIKDRVTVRVRVLGVLSGKLQ